MDQQNRAGRSAFPGLPFALLFFFFFFFASACMAQTSLRLPLPVDSPPGAVGFEAPAPTAGVLTGLLWPASGPLTSWAPLYSTLGADGSLHEVTPGGWVGPRPPKWLRVVKRGYVVGGFRVLVKTGPGVVQTRQVQIFWKPWVDGEAVGTVIESQVYGSPAGRQDTVRIIELRLPEAALPTGLYGETLGGAVVQASLIVRQAAVSTTTGPGPQPSRGPSVPVAPTIVPVQPVAPLPALN